MLDLLITNGQVVTPQGAGAWEIAVEGGRIEIGRASCRERV